MSVAIVRTVAELRDIVAGWRREGASVAVVPTMGALHAGHLSLVRAALEKVDRVIVTLFVNPKQFNSAADLAAYPRTEVEDAAKLAPLGAHLLYAPDATEIYPDGFATTVSVDGVSEGLCGAFRPGHFDGVATVVAKLFLQTGADLAFFGEKDFQQLHVVRRMARDLDIPITIVGCSTVREEDGLALSSRNVRLSPDKRKAAPKLASILFDAAGQIAGGSPVSQTLSKARAAILSAGYREVEYLELRADAVCVANGKNAPASRTSSRNFLSPEARHWIAYRARSRPEAHDPHGGQILVSIRLPRDPLPMPTSATSERQFPYQLNRSSRNRNTYPHRYKHCEPG